MACEIKYNTNHSSNRSNNERALPKRKTTGSAERVTAGPITAEPVTEKAFVHEPLPAQGNGYQSDLTHYFQQGDFGFVLFLPELNKVYWNKPAAALHGEIINAVNQPSAGSARNIGYASPYRSAINGNCKTSDNGPSNEPSLKIRGFNLRQFMQWYLPSQRDLFSQSLFAEGSNQGFQIDLCVAHNQQHVRYLCIPLPDQKQRVWAGFVRATQTRNNTELIDFALRKARQLLTELV
ncbi:hypothetical protein CWE08_05645 [Aliidiomarina iranensis]|uniref:Uncharacterized protein n=1 Tax=Aliidiomarina iranensis TaxID=1434071 RepID=A0A432W0Y9_9GAMM|nr:hypothetical protein [Aliidiomarina iranensis]RUO22648.1 hypothetical protein CWE08_05645 [Aliidiomarina iranensis]